MGGVPDLLNPSPWDPSTQTQVILQMRQDIRDLQRASGIVLGSSDVTLPTGTILRQKKVLTDALGNPVTADGIPHIFMTLPFTSQGGPVMLRGAVHITENKSAAAAVLHQCSIQVDGASPPGTLTYFSGLFNLATSGAAGFVGSDMNCLSYFPSLSSGPHTAQVMVTLVPSSTLGSQVYVSLELEEYASIG